MSKVTEGGGSAPTPPAPFGRHLPKCVHFNGIQHETCKAGVAYKSVRDSAARPYRWPCLTLTDGPAATTCAQYRALTDEEWAAIDREISEAIDRMGARRKAGQCVECGAAIARREVVGRCLYVEPCGHRQGQVNDEFAAEDRPSSLGPAPKDPK
jgi:hypothetical protein